jgi:alkanesulfonate monooxygenase SsuD/methylene tetrahydromethanopterin reductase-like flavin-dependent oxidoreductase (luciferase family)
MKVSINVTDYTVPGGPPSLARWLGEVGERVDDSAVDTLWVADHLLQADPTSTPEAEMLEACTTLGFLAARTSRVRLGTMVSAVTFRAPALLVKAMTTLDVLAGGRTWFGVGAGHAEDEGRAMGMPLPPVGERFEWLEDTLLLAARMWEGDASPFQGRRVDAERPIGNPRPLRRPSVLIGGMGERKTLRLVARHADACNVFDIPDGGRTVRHKLDVLRRHCEAERRDYDEIEKTISTRLTPGESAGAFAARCRELAGWGIEHVVCITPGGWDEPRLTVMADVAAAVR